jgi:hypothetical protein
LRASARIIFEQEARIMRIEKTGGPPPGRSKPVRRSAAGFALPAEPADPASPAEAAHSEAPAALTQAACVSLVDLAGDASDAPSRPDDRSAASHGSVLLQAMARLQVALLDGHEADARQTLAALAGAMPSAADPELETVLQAVAQRAAVELARSR